MEQRGGTINYENSLVYGFGTTIPHLKGASGGPMLNSQGEVVGVFSIYNGNLAYGTKVQHLWNFLKNRNPEKHQRAQEEHFVLGQTIQLNVSRRKKTM